MQELEHPLSAPSQGHLLAPLGWSNQPAMPASIFNAQPPSSSFICEPSKTLMGIHEHSLPPAPAPVHRAGLSRVAFQPLALISGVLVASPAGGIDPPHPLPPAGAGPAPLVRPPTKQPEPQEGQARDRPLLLMKINHAVQISRLSAVSITYHSISRNEPWMSLHGGVELLNLLDW